MLKKIITLCLLTLLVAISAYRLFAAPINPKLSKAQIETITKCVVPYVRLHTTKVVIFAIYDRSKYHLMRYSEDNEGNEFENEFIVKLNGNKCDIVYGDRMNEGPSVSEVFPNEFGRQATRNGYMYLISKRGKTELQKWLDSNPPLTQIQKEELSRLGLRVR